MARTSTSDVRVELDRYDDARRREVGAVKAGVEDEIRAIRREILNSITSLQEAIRVGDDALGRHIVDQVLQVHTALEGARTAIDIALTNAQREIDLRFAAERRTLELMASDRDRERSTFAESIADRFDQLREELTQRMTGIRRELEASNAASKEAVAKAEVATEKRLEGMNEFRSQLTDQTSSFLPRETFEAAVHDWDRWRSSTEERLNRSEGERRGRHQSESDHRDGIVSTAQILYVIIGIITIIVTIAIATHGFK